MFENHRPCSSKHLPKYPMYNLLFIPLATAIKVRHQVIASAVNRNPCNMHLPYNFSEALGIDKKAGPIKTLHVFDFDGTLIRSPGPEEGKAKFTRATGQTWTGGWWGNVETLKPPVVESPVPASMVITTVFDELEQVVTQNPTAVATVVTGRLSKFRADVRRILDEACTSREKQPFMHPGAVFTSPGGRMSTIQYKMELIKTMLTTSPLAEQHITELHIWEDREEHAQVFSSDFTQEILKHTGVETTVHLVPASMP